MQLNGASSCRGEHLVAEISPNFGGLPISFTWPVVGLSCSVLPGLLNNSLPLGVSITVFLEQPLSLFGASTGPLLFELFRGRPFFLAGALSALSFSEIFRGRPLFLAGALSALSLSEIFRGRPLFLAGVLTTLSFPEHFLGRPLFFGWSSVVSSLPQREGPLLTTHTCRWPKEFG